MDNFESLHPAVVNATTLLRRATDSPAITSQVFTPNFKEVADQCGVLAVTFQKLEKLFRGAATTDSDDDDIEIIPEPRRTVPGRIVSSFRAEGGVYHDGGRLLGLSLIGKCSALGDVLGRAISGCVFVSEEGPDVTLFFEQDSSLKETGAIIVGSVVKTEGKIRILSLRPFCWSYKFSNRSLRLSEPSTKLVVKCVRGASGEVVIKGTLRD